MERQMPLETMIIVVCVGLPFVAFAAVLFYQDLACAAHAKRARK
jgi:hypothetical protein